MTAEASLGTRCGACMDYPELVEEAVEGEMTGRVYNRYECSCGETSILRIVEQEEQ